ncbi:putative RNA-directed DNA polymerase from transposon X-element [Chionoecetes opilio]|uniref:Putative RNA-directed DNA polymerase from transposon X-element n=1 Tax=Chionoecetes opilio TaxID=41210 RepID=A0A8J4YCW5_CHIOP|nr:putative RNA-directed DNA polymerase from transposon X-element [Chionoecetes opilio]
MSDHKTCEATLTINALMNTIPQNEHKAQTEMAKLNFHHKDINWNGLRDKLKIEWETTLADKCPEEMLSSFTTICEEACREHVPLKSAANKKRLITRDRRILMKKRGHYKNKLTKCPPPFIEAKLRKALLEIETSLIKSHAEQRKKEEIQAVNNIKDNSKFFFSYANRKSKNISAVGPLESVEGGLEGDPMKMANILKGQYDSVFSVPNPVKTVHDPAVFFNTRAISAQTPHLTEITPETEELIEAIDAISSDSAAGPDGFHAMFLKQCKLELAVPLKLIATKSLASGIIPPNLKEGIVTPIHKGGNKGLAKNYRPVVLTSHIIKIIERVVKNHLTDHLEKTNAFNEGQHGFRKGRSCLSQLLAHQEALLEATSKGTNVDVIYLDFAKAFDKVDHGLLLHKLRGLGISGNLGKWIHTFLTGRTQKVSVQGHLSDPSDVVSGVPQGSVLGPLLFLIMIGDIDRGLRHSQATSFADDTRVKRGIATEEDVARLQEDLNHLLDWADTNNMSMNSDKFELMKYGPLHNIKGDTTYQAHQQTITPAHHVRDLGITMSADSTFSQHIINISNTAKKLTGWILRTFHTRERTCMLTLWKALVLPRLEYCCQLWSPYKKGDIVKLEALQRSFTSKIWDSQHMDYWERLRHLRLYSLQRRRERYLVIYVWKTLDTGT